MQTLVEVHTALDRIESGGPWTLDGAFSLPQALLHCAQSLEYSLSGYPAQVGVGKKIIGRIARHVILARGRLGHDRGAPIPGAPPLPTDLPLGEACQRLRAALSAFENHEGALAPHFMLGRLDKGQYALIHALHTGEHLASLAPKTN